MMPGFLKTLLIERIQCVNARKESIEKAIDHLNRSKKHLQGIVDVLQIEKNSMISEARSKLTEEELAELGELPF